jgi:hypothetical protein
MDTQLRRDVRWLKIYALCSTAAFGVLALSAFQKPSVPAKTKFDEIDVERINVVEKDGKLRMILSNRSRSSGPIAYGKPFGYAGGNRPGIIFFNDEGTENGGLTFSGKRGANGKYASTVHMSFDQYNEDQVVVLQYADDNGQQRKGLQIADRADVPILELVKQQEAIQKMPKGPARDSAMKRFMYVGRDTSKTALVLLSDKMGHPRLRLSVDSLGKASLDFLDGEGKVTRSIGDS